VLADGTYAGAFAARVDGQADRPVVVRAANKHRAVLPGSVAVDADHTWLHGLRFTGDDAVDIRGDRNAVTRCLFGRLNGILLHEGASHNKIGWNSFKDMPYYENEHKNAIRCDFRPTDPRFMTGNHIYRNYFTTAFAASDASAATETPTVYLGLSKAFSEPYPDTGFLVEHNLFVGIDYKSSVRVKADGNVIRFNTSIGPGSVSGAKNRAQFGQRHGERNKWYGNWAENTRGFKVNEHNQELLGNKAVGAATIDTQRARRQQGGLQPLAPGRHEGTCYVGNRDFRRR
jgi:hypothetical protein